jgi:hypothetical protein
MAGRISLGTAGETLIQIILADDYAIPHDPSIHLAVIFACRLGGVTIVLACECSGMRGTAEIQQGKSQYQ